MMKEQIYDIVVIGSGPSGRELSLHSTKNGFSVALIESELVGGDCAYWSCVPSKALLRPPEALAEARQVDGARQAAVGNLGVESVLKRRDFYVDNWDDHNLTKMMEEGGAVFAKRGIMIHTKVNIVNAKRSNPEGPVEIELDNGKMIEADELLVSVGRTPKTGDIGLETVGLKPQQWLDVDDTCLVQGLGDNDWLYAIGDINHRALLTHMGKYQGRASAKAILARARGTGSDDHSEWRLSAATADHDMTPQVIFTDPQVASVGLTEKDAKRLGLNTHLVDSEMGMVVGAQLHTDGYVGHARLVIDENKHIIVGATFIGPQISELLHSATIAVVGQVSINRLWHAVPSFPTVSEVWIQLLENYASSSYSVASSSYSVA